MRSFHKQEIFEAYANKLTNIQNPQAIWLKNKHFLYTIYCLNPKDSGICIFPDETLVTGDFYRTIGWLDKYAEFDSTMYRIVVHSTKSAQEAFVHECGDILIGRPRIPPRLPNFVDISQVDTVVHASIHEIVPIIYAYLTVGRKSFTPDELIEILGLRKKISRLNFSSFRTKLNTALKYLVNQRLLVLEKNRYWGDNSFPAYLKLVK